ncbi:hypothetical protein FX016_19865 [Cupriavidus gilardii]|nr:hypothetical protein FX016_19865 [Cupriavidus gilardii]
MSKKLDALLREHTWRGVFCRAICLGVFIVALIWLPDFVVWGEENIFKRQFVPNDEKIKLLRIVAGAFIFVIVIRDALAIRQLLRRHDQE